VTKIFVEAAAATGEARVTRDRTDDSVLVGDSRGVHASKPTMGTAWASTWALWPWACGSLDRLDSVARPGPCRVSLARASMIAIEFVTYDGHLPNLWP
jgi:hypothetical protein